MKVLEVILQVLQMLSTGILMILVLLQSENEGSNIITGAQEASSGAGMSKDKKLARATKVVGTAFIILTIAVATIMLYNAKM